MQLFEKLGFHWERSIVPEKIPVHSIERVCFRFYKMLPEFVWDASVLEGNPFTFPEVKTLLDGVTVGGHKISDQEQILNLAESSKTLLSLVKSNKFTLNKKTFCTLHAQVAKNEALEWGVFRGEGQEVNFSPKVSLGEKGVYTPIPTEKDAANLNKQFEMGLRALEQEIHQPFEKASAFFLFGALQQFFFDGNKRTSRLMMNGILMSNGMDAISVPAATVQEFNNKMVDFYVSKNATEMLDFLVRQHPEYEKIEQLNKKQNKHAHARMDSNLGKALQPDETHAVTAGDSLLSQAQTIASEQRALLENASLEQTLTATLKPYVEAKHAQIERIEARLGQVIEQQQNKMKQTKANPPKHKWLIPMLGMPVSISNKSACMTWNTGSLSSAKSKKARIAAFLASTNWLPRRCAESIPNSPQAGMPCAKVSTSSNNKNASSAKNRRSRKSNLKNKAKDTASLTDCDPSE